MSKAIQHLVPPSRPASRHRAFTLAEAVIASGFVAIALAGILSLAPALIRGQHEIAERTRANAAATELLGMFERQELPEMAPAEVKDNDELGKNPGLVGGLVGGLLTALVPSGSPPELEEAELAPITQINTTIRGFDAEINFNTIDPVTLARDTESKSAALITIVIRSGGRELARINTIRTDAWTRADQLRALAP